MTDKHTEYILSDVEMCLFGWNEKHKKSGLCSYCEGDHIDCDVFWELSYFVRNIPGIFERPTHEINRLIQKAEGLLNQLFYLE